MVDFVSEILHLDGGALEQFKKALFLKPEDGKIYYNLGLIYHIVGHLDGAKN